MSVRKEENVEDEVTHHQLRGLEKKGVAVGLFLQRGKPIPKEGIIMNLHQNHLHSLCPNHLYSLRQNIHQNLQHLHHQKKKKKTWKWQ